MGRCIRAPKTICPICHNCHTRLSPEKGLSGTRLREYRLSSSGFENSPSRTVFYAKIDHGILDFAFWGWYLCGVTKPNY